jgi:hypothetical protein
MLTVGRTAAVTAEHDQAVTHSNVGQKLTAGMDPIHVLL